MHAAGLSLVPVPASPATPANLRGIFHTVIQSWVGGKKNQSLEQLFVVNRDNAIISVFNLGYLCKSCNVQVL